jgi:hypothetical protein
LYLARKFVLQVYPRQNRNMEMSESQAALPHKRLK